MRGDIKKNFKFYLYFFYYIKANGINFGTSINVKFKKEGSKMTANVEQNGRLFGVKVVAEDLAFGEAPFNVALYSQKQETDWRVSHLRFGDGMAIIPSKVIGQNTLALSELKPGHHFTIQTKFHQSIFPMGQRYIIQVCYIISVSYIVPFWI